MKIVSVADVGETETSRCLQLLKVFCQCEIRRISYKVWKFPVSVNVIEQKVVKKEAQYFSQKVTEALEYLLQWFNHHV